MQPAQIHGICICQNVDDVIKSCIEQNANYLDAIHVWDIGSSDNTSEILSELSSTLKHLHIKSVRREFTNDLRGLFLTEIIEQFPHITHYYQLDSDEFINETPDSFRRKVTNSNVLYSWHMNYEFAKSQADDALIPFKRENYRHVSRVYSEIRGFRIPNSMNWEIGNREILPLGLIVPQGLRYPLLPSPFRFVQINHYPKRSRKQLIKRAKEKESLLKSAHFDNSSSRINYRKYKSANVLNIVSEVNSPNKLRIFCSKGRIYFERFIRPILPRILRKLKKTRPNK